MLGYSIIHSFAELDCSKVQVALRVVTRTSPAVGTLLVIADWLLAMVALATLPRLLLFCVKSRSTAFCCLVAAPRNDEEFIRIPQSHAQSTPTALICADITTWMCIPACV